MGNWFQQYRQLKDWTNNKTQKKLSALFGCILKTVFASSDSFCLITSHLIIQSGKRVLASIPNNIKNQTNVFDWGKAWNDELVQLIEQGSSHVDGYMVRLQRIRITADNYCYSFIFNSWYLPPLSNIRTFSKFHIFTGCLFLRGSIFIVK